MNPIDWDYTRAEIDEARTVTDGPRIKKLSEHSSRFVRAVVAGNSHTPLHIRQILSQDKSAGVVYWLIGNKSLSKHEFDNIWDNSRSGNLWKNLKTALLGSHHVSIYQLREVCRLDDWVVRISILNNHHGRDDEYKALIFPYLPREDTPYKSWTEIEKLAYFRTTGKRVPNNLD